jgi:r-opsin
LLNLALSDLLKVAISLPMPVISSFYGKWIFGQLGSTFYAWTSGLFGFVNIVTLAVMSFERYLIMRDSINVARIFNGKIKIGYYL